MARAFSLTTPPPLTKLPTKTFPKCPSLLYPFFPQSSRNTPLTVTFSSRNAPPSKTPAPKPSLFSEGRDEDESRLVCPGCGIFMQDSNPNLPGFYQKPLSSPPKTPEDSDKFLFDELDVEEEEEIDGSLSKSDLGSEFDGLLDRGEEEFDAEDEKLKIEFGEFAHAGAGLDNIVEEIPKKLFDEFDEEDEHESDRYSSLTKYTLKKLKGEKISEAEKGKKAREAKRVEDLKMIGPDLDAHDPLLWDSDDEFVEKVEEEMDGSQSKSDLGSEFGRFSDWDEEEFDDEDEKSKKELDGFGPAGVGYGNITEETLKKLKKEKISKAEKKKKAREAKKKEEEENAVIVCARCHSLRNYGQVKNPNAENLIPDFDFDRLISTRLMRPTTSAPLVIMVVDCVDFDGSFPKRAAKSLFKALEVNKKNPKITKLPKLVLVATKVDLLPSQISPTRLDRWVRNRAKAAGAPKLSGVYLVSARKDLGVRNLLSFIKDLAGPRGNVWVIGAQNAGKSTLINTFAKKDGVKATRLTEAPIPGTTLGILRIPGILPAKAKMYDTPGLLHPYLMSMRLNREEQKMVEIRKELQPRTYRMKAGQTVHVGGLMRLDLTHSSVDTIYISIWASPNVSLHMGKTENADEIREKHVGIRLQPPISQDRVSELGEWKPKEIKVSGVSWGVNSIDIAVSGLGWFSLGMKGEATVTLWTFDGVEVTQREPLVLDRAPFLERPGFLLPKAISDFIGNQSKIEAKAKKKMEEETNLTGVALS